ncbi:MAG: amidohydrolase family protein [Verrucomicrobia bacterium]|nr:amidohydrolase family protein [Verrucomicrobiota bacterium]
MSAALVDTNVYLSRWPFRRLPLDEPQALVDKLRQHNVTQAWTGSFDGLLHKDIASVNARLAEDCEKFGKNLLLPFGSINPTLPDWEEDLRRCHEQFKMRGVRLHPNYHGYKLDEPMFEKLLRAATERSLIVQIAVSMEDRRTQSAIMPVLPVDVNPLAKIVEKVPNVRAQLLNALQLVRGAPLLSTLAAGHVLVEIATLEGAGGIQNLLTSVSVEKIAFGSYAPFFNFESALLKMKESELSEAQRNAISTANAKRLLGGK